jgi:hypothetical protein
MLIDIKAEPLVMGKMGAEFSGYCLKQATKEIDS